MKLPGNENEINKSAFITRDIPPPPPKKMYTWFFAFFSSPIRTSKMKLKWMSQLIDAVYIDRNDSRGYTDTFYISNDETQQKVAPQRACGTESINFSIFFFIFLLSI